MGQLAAGSYGGTAYGPAGRPRTVTVGGPGDLFVLLAAGDGSDLLRAQFSPAVEAALRGDRVPLMRLFLRARSDAPPPVTALSAGLYVATICTDVRMPWAPGSDPGARGPLFDAAVAALDPAAFAPFDVAAARDTSLSGGCIGWPAVPTRPDDVPSAYAPVPALILSGLSDVRTPVESARRVAALIPGSTLVTVPGTGHDVLVADRTGCARRALDRFLRGRAAGGACRRSNGLDRTARAFPLRLRDLRGGARRVSRDRLVLRAALRTVADAQDVLEAGRSLTVRAGGLRGGWMRGRIRPGGFRMRLHDYVFLPGLRVTGTVALGNHSSGLVRLSGIARGRISFGRNDVTATIDGHVVRSRRSG